MIFHSLIICSSKIENFNYKVMIVMNFKIWIDLLKEDINFLVLTILRINDIV